MHLQIAPQELQRNLGVVERVRLCKDMLNLLMPPQR